MIDFQNAAFMKLRPVHNTVYANMIAPLFVEGEHILESYQGARDGVVFTNKRIITINIQGVSGKKKDFTSLPYSKIQVYSVETAGSFDRDAELELWFSGVGKVKLEFIAQTDVAKICHTISNYVL